jgi:teichoic acid D-alanine hydrolase
LSNEQEKFQGENMKQIVTGLLILIFVQLAFGETSEFTKIVESYKTEKNFNGAVVIATDGKIDFIGGVGLADRQSSINITPQSKFKIASITKTFTAVLIMKLHEQGKIDLNATVDKYFPEYKGIGKDKITVRQLLTFSSGIINEGEKSGMLSYKSPLTLDEYIGKYCSGNLEFEPGSKSVYANTEYIILGKIIENITKKSYAEVLQEHILSPLKMKDSGVVNSKKTVSGLVKSYTQNEANKAFEADEPYLIENYFASGAMYSTVEDLLKFDTAIFKNKILQPKTTELMLKIYPDLGNAAFGFWGSDGYGTFAEKFYYRPGGILGSNSNWIHTIKNKKTIIVMSNTNATNLFELSEKLYPASLGKK